MNKSFSAGALYFLFIFLLFLSSFSVFAQSGSPRSKAYESYINTYSVAAINNMKSHKIPASITLAQGLLESGAGQSVLAVQGNNHFGIKCAEWTGDRIYKDDDKKNECFRKYKHAEESFNDHSLFLTGRSRYDFLFKLQITDYRGWAKGLQTAGYATDKAYANKLIKLIEDYELYQYDQSDNKQINKGKDKKQESKPVEATKKPASNKNVKPSKNTVSKPSKVYSHTPYITHGLVYVVAKQGDTYESIANEFDFDVSDLCKYNEVPEGFPLADGDLVYFQNKNKKANKPYYEHIVKVGESMHSVSQRYGMKVQNLYKMNKKDLNYVPVEGDVLKLR